MTRYLLLFPILIRHNASGFPGQLFKQLVQALLQFTRTGASGGR
jgi:hypothetical protein